MATHQGLKHEASRAEPGGLRGCPGAMVAERGFPPDGRGRAEVRGRQSIRRAEGGKSVSSKRNSMCEGPEPAQGVAAEERKGVYRQRSAGWWASGDTGVLVTQVWACW